MEKQGYRDQLAELNEKYPDKSTLTVSEAAKELGISIYTLYDELKKIRPCITCQKVGNKIIISKTVLARFMVGGSL